MMHISISYMRKVSHGHLRFLRENFFGLNGLGLLLTAAV